VIIELRQNPVMAKVHRNTSKAGLIGLGFIVLGLTGCAAEAGAVEPEGAPALPGGFIQAYNTPLFSESEILIQSGDFDLDSWDIDNWDMSDWPDDWWFNADAPDLLPQVIELTPDLLREFGWTGSNITPEMSQLIEYFTWSRSADNPSEQVEPVWQPEEQTLTLWVDPNVDVAPIYEVVISHGIDLSDVEVRHRQFAMADLQAALNEIWGNGIAGYTIVMSSIRYDGSGIDVGISDAFDGPLDQPIAWVSEIPIYPSFGAVTISPLG